MKAWTKVAAVALTIAATAMASSACFWWMHQPEEPKCLREE